MEDLTDRPALPQELDSYDPVVRVDVGGWISGPCLFTDELDLLPGWQSDLEATQPGSQRRWPAR